MSTLIGTSSDQKNLYYYKYELKIAQGAFGSVYCGLKKPNSLHKEPELIAIKIFERGNNRERLSIDAEIKALQSIKHDNVVEVLDMINTENYYNKTTHYIILELCNCGSIEDYVENNELSDLEIRYLFKQMAEGLHFIHKKNYIHRDIKPNNILLKENVIIKIADFGEARELKKEEKAETLRGTPFYMNPQMLNGEKYTNKGDIFSLGVVLYFMYYKKTPWFNNKESEKNSTKNENSLYKIYQEAKVNNFNMIFKHLPEVHLNKNAKDLIKTGIFSPKIVKNLNEIFFIEKKGLINNQEKIIQELLIKEGKKGKVREIMERMYYERDKIVFIHNCMKSCYSLKILWENKENWQETLLVLTQLASFKSQFFYEFLKKKKNHLFFLKEDWKLFYENNDIYEKTLEMMKRCFQINEKNLENFLKGMTSNNLRNELLVMVNDNYKGNIDFFEELQRTILDSLKIMKNYNEKDNEDLVIVLYELMIILTMNGSMGYFPERGIVNFEKYHEDKKYMRSIEIIKMRLESFYEIIKTH